MIFSRLLSFSRFQSRGVWQFSFGRTLLRKFINLLCTGPSQRLLCGLRPLVSIGPLPLPVSGGGHALRRRLPHALLRFEPYKKEVEPPMLLNGKLAALQRTERLGVPKKRSVHCSAAAA